MSGTLRIHREDTNAVDDVTLWFGEAPQPDLSFNTIKIRPIWEMLRSMPRGRQITVHGDDTRPSLTFSWILDQVDSR